MVNSLYPHILDTQILAQEKTQDVGNAKLTTYM